MRGAGGRGGREGPEEILLLVLTILSPSVCRGQQLEHWNTSIHHDGDQGKVTLPSLLHLHGLTARWLDVFCQMEENECLVIFL